MSFTVVSFFTLSTPYENEAKKLVASLKAHNVPYHVVGITSAGSWEKNCQFKAKYILQEMERTGSNVVWIDADAVVTKYPSLFDTIDCDVAYHYLEHREELLSGTLFFRNNERTISLIKEWIALNETNYRWDQKNLQDVMEKNTLVTKMVLPAEYCKIYDNKNQYASDPVITHYQASRRYKRLVGTAAHKMR